MIVDLQHCNWLRLAMKSIRFQEDDRNTRLVKQTREILSSNKTLKIFKPCEFNDRLLVRVDRAACCHRLQVLSVWINESLENRNAGAVRPT